MSTSAEPDWGALARSPKFPELLASRRRFLVAGTAFLPTTRSLIVSGAKPRRHRKARK
jgi:hypothetical protein